MGGRGLLGGNMGSAQADRLRHDQIAGVVLEHGGELVVKAIGGEDGFEGGRLGFWGKAGPPDTVD